MAEQQEQESNPQYPTEPPPLPPAVAPPPRPRRPDPARAQGIGSMLLVTGALAAVAGGLVQAGLLGIRVSGQGLANMGNLLLAWPLWLAALIGMCVAGAAVAGLAMRLVRHRVADIGFALWVLALALHGHAVFAYVPLLKALRGPD